MAELGTSVEKFNAAVGKFAKDLPVQILVPFQKRIVFAVLNGVVLKTPVLTGRARGNWQVTIGTPATGEIDVEGPGQKAPLPSKAGVGKAGSEALSKGPAVLGVLRPFEVVWITNNVPYIEVLEDGDHSAQAPFGMVALTLDEVRSIFP